MKIILGRKGSVTCIIEHDAKMYTPLIMFGSYIYDPLNNYNEVNSGNYFKIFERCREDAEALYESCREVWEKGTYKKELEGKDFTYVPTKPEVPEQPAQPTQTSSALDQLIAQAVANIAVDDVITLSKHEIDKYISETYGSLPKRIEVTSPAGKKIIDGIVHEQFEDVLKLGLPTGILTSLRGVLRRMKILELSPLVTHSGRARISNIRGVTNWTRQALTGSQ